MGDLNGSSPFFKPGPPAEIGAASPSVLGFLMKNAEGRVLDLGGGRGAYSHELAKRGFDVTLGEIDPECLASAAASGLRTLDMTVTPWVSLEGKFDTVLLVEVLEHVREFRDFLTNAIACSASKILITVPCNDDFQELFSYNLTYNHIAVSDHINHFTSWDLRDLLDETGWALSIEKGDYLLRSSILPLVFSRMRRSFPGCLAAYQLALLCKLGWVPDAIPGRIFAVLTRPKSRKRG